MELKRGRGTGSKANVGRKPAPPGLKRVNRSTAANDVEWAAVIDLAHTWGCSIPDAILRAVFEACVKSAK